MTEDPSVRGARTWLDHATVWRWHFYAGLFCLPFFLWLALTGTVYLFRPDIEAWLDQSFEDLSLDGPRAAPSSEVRAALAAVPGAALSRYEPPATPTGAAQVVLAARDGRLMRAYVHPVSLQVLRLIQDDHRPMDLTAHLHGNLLLDGPGSAVVEVAGSWGVVMILTGFYLWLPRGAWRPAGLLYPRLRERGRLFWRDLHSVTAFWVSGLTLFMLLSGLPWSASWGNYLLWVRTHVGSAAAAPAWPVGGHDMSAHHAAAATLDLTVLDRLVPLAARLDLARPVWISPPAIGAADWSIASHTQNRPLRVSYAVSPETGRVTGIRRFADEALVDRIILRVIAAHEGQLFGRLNQAILLLMAGSLVVVVASALLMWWRRRPRGALGAPPVPAATWRQGGVLLALAIITLSLLLPLFALSLLLLLVLDRMVLVRLPAARRWLGLRPVRI